MQKQEVMFGAEGVSFQRCSQFQPLRGNCGRPEAQKGSDSTGHFAEKRRRCQFLVCRPPCKSLSRGNSSPDARFGGARTANLPEFAARTVPLGGWFLPSQNRTSIRCLRSGGPSQKIECVFSASPETIRREPREFDLRRSVGKRQDLAVCA